MSIHKRPSALTRLWFPLLFLPPVLLTTTRALVRNKAWLEEQVRNGKETIRGFLVQWVWEPVEDIAKTLRSGGEGLGVAPTTVKSDQDSLERMVLDLGRDYYHLQGDALEALKGKIRGGDMEEVLRVYEKEMQVSDCCACAELGGKGPEWRNPERLNCSRTV
jgi:nuclear-control-of-ATPase protein 2